MDEQEQIEALERKIENLQDRCNIFELEMDKVVKILEQNLIVMQKMANTLEIMERRI